MEIYYCKKCHLRKNEEDYQKFIKKIETNFNVKVEEGCFSFCGPGKSLFSVSINDEVIVADNKEELLKKIGEKCK